MNNYRLWLGEFIIKRTNGLSRFTAHVTVSEFYVDLHHLMDEIIILGVYIWRYNSD